MKPYSVSDFSHVFVQLYCVTLFNDGHFIDEVWSYDLVL